MSTLAERVQQYMSETGRGVADIARAAGKTSSAVSQWLSGGTKALKGDTAAALEANTGYRASWWSTGVGPKLAASGDLPEANVEPGPDFKGPGHYPLISWVQAGSWTEICDQYAPGDGERPIASHHNLGKCGYVLRVNGGSMTAPPGSPYSFPEGMLVYVHPEKDPNPGQFVIVRREREKAATFKRLISVDGDLYLEAINPDWPNRYLKLEEGDVFCGVVVDASFGNLP